MRAQLVDSSSESWRLLRSRAAAVGEETTLGQEEDGAGTWVKRTG